MYVYSIYEAATTAYKSTATWPKAKQKQSKNVMLHKITDDLGETPHLFCVNFVFVVTRDAKFSLKLLLFGLFNFSYGRVDLLTVPWGESFIILRCNDIVLHDLALDLAKELSLTTTQNNNLKKCKRLLSEKKDQFKKCFIFAGSSSKPVIFWLSGTQ